MKHKIHFLSLFVLVLAVPVFAAEIAPNNLVLPLEYHHQVLLPVAGNTAGANGTFFRSDVNIVNLRATEQRLRLTWLPQGRSGVGLQAREISIPGASGFFSEDFVTNIMQETGLGSVLIQAITAGGVVDDNARLLVTSRIWTPAPGGGGGTYSQTFPVVPIAGRSDAPPKWIFGIRRDDRYRLNVGIVNRSAVRQNFSIRTAGSNPPGAGEITTIELEPLSMQQINIPGAGGGSFQIVIESLNGSSLWDAWASSIDNTTGDAWSMIAVNQPLAAPTTE